jgi:hypothetical protein
MPSLEDVKKALEASQGGAQLFEFVTGEIEKLKTAVDGEKQKGISEVNKRNKEAEGLRKFKKAFESLGFSSDENDLDSFVSELSETLKGGAQGGNAKESPEYKELQKTVSKLQKSFETVNTQLETEKKSAQALKQKAQSATIKQALLKDLSSKVYGADIVADNLISAGKIRLDEGDGETIVFIEGDAAIPYDKGLQKFLELRKDLIKNSQSGGAGGGGSGDNSKDDGNAKPNLDRTKELRRLSQTVHV